jgi:branched-chain amino acid transport system permease protein
MSSASKPASGVAAPADATAPLDRAASRRAAMRGMAVIAIGFAIYLAATWVVQDRYYQLMFTLVPIWATVGVAWNLFSGYSGLMSFGHAAFFGIGAYTVALLLVHFGVSPWIGIVIAALAGGVAGIVIGMPTFRLRGHYFALAMLAYPLAILYVFEWLGFQEVTLPMNREHPALYMQFADQRIYVVIALALLLLALAVNIAVARSRFGLSLLAIKQNEAAAMGAGINPRAWKLRAIMLSGALTATAGGLYAVVLLIVTPATVFGMLVSAQALIMTLFGGIATIAGPVLGALILVPLGETLHAQLASRLPGIQGVVFGAAIIAVVLIAPEGILPWITARRQKRRQARERAAPLALDSAPYVRPPGERVAPAGGWAALLTVSGVSVRFGGLQALSNVAFDVREGEIFGVIGPNGAGKTTLFNALNGFITPATGSVKLGARELVGEPAFNVCRAGIGRTFQVVRPFTRLSVQDNVVIGAFPVERTDAMAYVAARESIRRVGLAGHEQRIASTLTNVELRLMELARALAARPRLVLLDEILAGLGSREIEHVLKVIDDVRRQGVTVVIIEHTMHAMVRLADRLLVIDHGEVLTCGDPKKVTSDPKVIEAYLGKRWASHAKG